MPTQLENSINSFMKKSIEYKERCKKKHKNKYSYEEWPLYAYSHDKLPIVCPVHGIFHQRLSTHLSGGGCKKCAIDRSRKHNTKSSTQHINEFNKIHNFKYIYYPETITRITDTIPIKCPEHGIFNQKASSHKQGSGCPKCAKDQQKQKISLTPEQVVKKAKKVHGIKYDYTHVYEQYRTHKTPVDILCSIHGKFTTTMGNHIYAKTDCPQCGQERGNAKRRTPFKDRIVEMEKIHSNTYTYPNQSDTNIHDTITIHCPTHGMFEQQMLTHLQGWGCKKCSALTRKSRSEEDLYNEVLKLDDTIESSNRTLIAPKELDIVSVKHKIAIEYCGVYWHSERFKNKRYHNDKLEATKKQGYRLITIFEDEWIYKKDHVLSRLKSIFNCSPNRIYARKCTVQQISSIQSNDFVEQNHIQGKRPTRYNYGLFFNKRLVSVMTLSKTHEIIRFCSLLDWSVVGGAGKLLKYHIQMTSPTQITSFADRRWSDGNLYRILGFEFVYNTPLNYWYFKNPSIKLISRRSFQKHTLSKKLDKFDVNLSESQNMFNNGYDRIWDCGSSKWALKLD